tara:strand:+ start:3968 stop:4423 length:456 start_codon:yes stop_codon:yes gene_type:complete
MANVNLYTKFDFTDADGNLYSDGSTTTAKTITITNGEIFDRTYKIASSTITEILSDAKIATFDFLYIESDQAAEIQLVCTQGGSAPTLQNGWVVKLNAGVPFVLANDDSRNQGNTGALASWESAWTAGVVDAIEYYQTTGSDAKVRVVAIG